MNKKPPPPPEYWPTTHAWPLKKGVKIVAIKEMFPPIYVLSTGESVYGVLPRKKSKKKKSKVVKSKSQKKGKKSKKIQDDDGEKEKKTF